MVVGSRRSILENRVHGLDRPAPGRALFWVVSLPLLVAGCVVADTGGLAGPPSPSKMSGDASHDVVLTDGSSTDGATTDARATDSGAADSGSDSAFDSGSVDSGSDAAPVDASIAAAGSDAGASDAGFDSGCGTCTSGLSCCGTCVNLLTDPNHCGLCTRVCGAGTSCSAGKCCPTGQTNCNNLCVNLLVSTSNCGMCGMVCPTHPPMPAACVNGACR